MRPRACRACRRKGERGGAGRTPADVGQALKVVGDGRGRRRNDRVVESDEDLDEELQDQSKESTAAPKRT